MGALLWASNFLGQEIATPPGWTMTTEGGRRLYRPNNLPQSGTFTVVIEPLASDIDASQLEQWFNDRVKADAAKRASLERSDPLQHQAFGALAMERVYRGRDGRLWDAVYVGFPLKQHRAVFCYSESNLPFSDTFLRYLHDGGKLCGEIARSINGPPAAK
jgi:hypothetical protein